MIVLNQTRLSSNAGSAERNVHKLYEKYILSFIDENDELEDTLVITLFNFLKKNIEILDGFRVTIEGTFNIINEQPIAALIKSQSEETQNVIQTVNAIIA